jgi:hypothetical protein
VLRIATERALGERGVLVVREALVQILAVHRKHAGVQEVSHGPILAAAVVTAR